GEARRGRTDGGAPEPAYRMQCCRMEQSYIPPVTSLSNPDAAIGSGGCRWNTPERETHVHDHTDRDPAVFGGIRLKRQLLGDVDGGSMSSTPEPWIASCFSCCSA